MPTLEHVQTLCKPELNPECDSIGAMLRRLRLLRRDLEQRIRPHFDADVSMALDRLLLVEELLAELDRRTEAAHTQ